MFIPTCLFQATSFSHFSELLVGLTSLIPSDLMIFLREDEGILFLT